MVLLTIFFFIGKLLFKSTGEFIALLFAITYTGRNTGNRLIKIFLFLDKFTLILIGLIWGNLIALLIRLLMIHIHVNTILTIIGYLGGCYASIINYDIFMGYPEQAGFPHPYDKMLKNQETMNYASIISFIISSIIFFFFL